MVQSNYAVITGIGFDHTDWLGTTLGAIAGEKAAIIKPCSRVFSSVSGEESLAPIRRAAEECDAPLHLVGKESRVRVVESAIGRLVVDLQIGSKRFAGLEAPLTGGFHSSNMALAAMVAVDRGLSEAAVRSGLLGLRDTGYRGRLELIGSTPAVLLDVSHNADGVRATVDALLPFIGSYDRISVLLGLLPTRMRPPLFVSCFALGADLWWLIFLPGEACLLKSFWSCAAVRVVRFLWRILWVRGWTGCFRRVPPHRWC